MNEKSFELTAFKFELTAFKDGREVERLNNKIRELYSGLVTGDLQNTLSEDDKKHLLKMIKESYDVYFCLAMQYGIIQEEIDSITELYTKAEDIIGVNRGPL